MKKFFNKDNLLIIFTVPVIIFGILSVIIPSITTIKDSFSIYPDKYDYTETSVVTSNFSRVLNDPIFKTSIHNTLLTLFVFAPITLFVSFAIAMIVSSISKKVFKNTFVAIIFSQFFVSSYAIGVSFMILFNAENNVLNSIFGTNIPWYSNSSKHGTILALFIFYFWRMSVISVVLFVFSINKINKKSFQLGLMDNLSFLQKIKIIYIPKMKNILLIQLYIFIFESLFFYPTIFKDPVIVDGQTIMTYIIMKAGSPNVIDFNLAAASSVLLSCFIFLLILNIFIISKIPKIIKHIMNRRTNHV